MCKTMAFSLQMSTQLRDVAILIEQKRRFLEAGLPRMTAIHL